MFWNYFESTLSRLRSDFSGWCFTHQYKNTTQFYFYAALLSSQNTNTKWASFETVKDSEFTVEFAKCGAIAFVSVIRDNNGSENVDKQIEYPDKYKPFHKISVSNYSSDKEAFIELDTKLRIYAVQGHWVRINIVYPVQI